MLKRWQRKLFKMTKNIHADTNIVINKNYYNYKQYLMLEVKGIITRDKLIDFINNAHSVNCIIDSIKYDANNPHIETIYFKKIDDPIKTYYNYSATYKSLLTDLVGFEKNWF